MAIAITSQPSSRQDTGILAQQSDVRCKRGRLGVIMIAPAAHTSKGLAKAFVSSAGARGRRTGILRPLLSCTQRREVALYRVQAGRLCIAKCPFAEKTYAGLCRPVMRHCARRGTSSKV